MQKYLQHFNNLSCLTTCGSCLSSSERTSIAFLNTSSTRGFSSAEKSNFKFIPFFYYKLSHIELLNIDKQIYIQICNLTTIKIQFGHLHSISLTLFFTETEDNHRSKISFHDHLDYFVTVRTIFEEKKRKILILCKYITQNNFICDICFKFSFNILILVNI